MPMCSSQLGKMSHPFTSKRAEDDSPISDILLAPLNELQTLAHTLFLSLSPPQSKPPPPPPLSAFIDCDKALAAAINKAHVHQVKQRRIDALETEILQLETQWRSICIELARGKAELEEIIEGGDIRIKAIDEARKGTFLLSCFCNVASMAFSSVNTIP